MLQISSDTNKRVLDARLLRFRSNPESEHPIPLANELMQAGRYGDARGVLVSSYKGNEQDLQLLLMEARAWFVERDFERAQAALHQAMRSDPSCVDVYFFLGELMLKRGDPNRALTALNKGLQFDPNDERIKTLHARADRLSAIVEREQYQPQPEPTEPSDADWENIDTSAEQIDARPAAAALELQSDHDDKNGAQPERQVERITDSEKPITLAIDEPARCDYQDADVDEEVPSTVSYERLDCPETGIYISDDELETKPQQAVIEEISSQHNEQLIFFETETIPENKAIRETAMPVPPPTLDPIGIASSCEKEESASGQSLVENDPFIENEPSLDVAEPQLPESESTPQFEEAEPSTIAEPQCEPFAIASDFAELAESEPLATTDLTLDLEELQLPEFEAVPEIQPSQVTGTHESATQHEAFTVASDSVHIDEPGHCAIDEEMGLEEAEAPSLETQVLPRFETIRPIGFPEPTDASQTNDDARDGAWIEVPKHQDMSALWRIAGPNRDDLGSKSASELSEITPPESHDSQTQDNREGELVDEFLSLGEGQLAFERAQEPQWEPSEQRLDLANISKFEEQEPQQEPSEQLREPANISESEEQEPQREPSEQLREPANISESEEPTKERSLSTSAQEATVDAALTSIADAVVQRSQTPPQNVESLAPLELKQPLYRRRSLRLALVISIAALFLVSIGGYWGWQHYQSMRRARGLQLLAKIDNALSVGDSDAVSAAESYFREASHYLKPYQGIYKSALLVSVYSVLENGKSRLGPLRTAIQRARTNGVDKRIVQVAKAVVALFSEDMTGARKAFDFVKSSATNHPLLLDISGRVAYRLGADDADHYFKTAIARDPRQLSAKLALAQLMRDRDQSDRALTYLQQISKSVHGHKNAALLELDILADEQDPAQLLTRLNQLVPPVSRIASRDDLRATLLRARLLQQQGESESAGQLFEKSFGWAKNNAFWLDDVARSAFRAQRLADAKTAAIRAVDTSPGNTLFRRLLAEILLASRDIQGARAALAPLPQNEPYHLVTRAVEALQSQKRKEIEASVEALDTYPAISDLSSIETQALRIRAKAIIGADQPLLEAAKRLATRAPRNPRVLRALGETALAIEEVKEANRVFRKLVAIAPDDADSHYLLGLSLWKSADSKKAEACFRQAIEIASEHKDAHLALGRLLLDQGRFDEAMPIYQVLTSSTQGALLGALGCAEALIGLGRLKEAEKQLKTIPKASRNTVAARTVAARLAIAWSRPFDAMTYLEPVIESPEVKATELTLYADAYFAAGRIDVAARYYKAALGMKNDLPEALFGSAKVAIRAGRSDGAIAVLERLLKRLEKDIRSPEFRAMALTALGHAFVQQANGGTTEDGYQVLQKATAIESAPIEAYFWLGESIAGIRAVDAGRAYKHYLEVEPKGKYAERAKRALVPRP